MAATQTYRFICCKLDVVATEAAAADDAVKAVSECRLRAFCCAAAVADLGGGAGGVDVLVVADAAVAFVTGLLGAELEFELVLLLVLVEFGEVVTVVVESFDDDDDDEDVV